MKYSARIYYINGGCRVFEVRASSIEKAETLARAVSRRREPGGGIERIVIKRMPQAKPRLYAANPFNPFGEPFDDIEDVSIHPRAAWYA
jgi:hypothetical protein